MRRVAVIGGAGFIGSHLVDALIANGDSVAVADNLFLGRRSNVNPAASFSTVYADNVRDIERFIQRFKPDLVYNLAVMPLPHSIVSPYHNISNNVAITQHLCDLLRAKEYGQLVHFSSSEVYGSAQYEPMCEDHPWKASTPYAASKAACDMICLSYVRTFDCNISILRPFNNYGPRQNAGSYAGIIPLTINRIRHGEPIIIYGDGHQTRDYIYVKDTARAAVILGNRKDQRGEVFNVGAGHDYSINWLVFEIAELMKTNAVIEYQPSRLGDIRRHIANVLKAKDVLGFEHTTPMTDGLRDTIDFYLKE